MDDMFLKICAGITAASALICASFCVWMAVNMYSFSNALQKTANSLNPKVSSSVTSVEQLERERAAIEAHLNGTADPVTVSASHALDEVYNPYRWDGRMMKAYEEGMRLQEERRRKNYTGFPGYYDSERYFDPFLMYWGPRARPSDTGAPARPGAH